MLDVSTLIYQFPISLREWVLCYSSEIQGLRFLLLLF